MFYYGDKLEAINAHLDRIRTKWIAGAGEAADALRVLEGFLAQVTRGIVR